MRRFVLADTQDITRFGIRQLASQLVETEYFEVSSKPEVIKLISDFPDSIVIFDYTRFDFRSPEELTMLEARFPSVDWIVFSDDLSSDFVRNLVFDAKRFSILLKDSSIDEIKSCLREVLKSYRFICNRIGNMLLDLPKVPSIIPVQELLTVTEREILKEIAAGKTTREIAATRFVSMHTIMTHRKNIFRKLEVNNVHEATKYAIRSGLIDLAEYYI